jgi:hypothetical protein
MPLQDGDWKPKGFLDRVHPDLIRVATLPPGHDAHLIGCDHRDHGVNRLRISFAVTLALTAMNRRDGDRPKQVAPAAMDLAVALVTYQL